MDAENKYTHKLLTIPNILSLIRILLIPLFCWLYLGENEYRIAAGVWVLSGITDAADGFIARHWNMISNFGKAFDPIADKLTQAAMLLCLLSRFPHMLWLFLLLAVKEITMGITSLIAIRKTGKVIGSSWHGKIMTALLYASMLLHLLWAEIPQSLSKGIILLCVCAMATSFVLYLIRNIKWLRGTLDSDTAA